MSIKVYISGPMSGKPEYNRVAFEEAAKELREMYFDVVSPIEKDRESGFDLQGPLSPEQYWDFLGRDVETIGTSGLGAVVVLEDWYQSVGSRLEVFQALLMKIPIYAFKTMKLITPPEVLVVLASSITEEL